MIRTLVLRLSCFAVCMLLSLTAAAQEFSGVIVDHRSGKEETPAKIFVGQNKIRIESPDSERMRGVVIMDFSKQVVDVLVPEQHMYIESKVGEGPTQRMFRFFRAGDVNDACSEWVRMADHPKGTCHRIGSDTVNGRSAVKYEGTNEDGETGYFWLDSKLRFPLKWEDHDDTGELRDIQEAHQPDSLFAIPGDYQKMDMGNMMGRRPQP